MAGNPYQQSDYLTGAPIYGSGPTGGGGWSQQDYQAFESGAMVASVFGIVTSAIGSYYSLKAQQYQLRAQAQNQTFAAEMASINRRGAEFNAGAIAEAGQRTAGQYTMRAGQARASARAGLAGRGLALGTGSARDVLASMDVVKEIDRLNINAATVRAREQARMEGVGLRSQSVMHATSAQNLLASAGTITPWFGASSALLGQGADVAYNWARNRRYDELLSGLSGPRI